MRLDFNIILVDNDLNDEDQKHRVEELIASLEKAIYPSNKAKRDF